MARPNPVHPYFANLPKRERRAVREAYPKRKNRKSMPKESLFSERNLLRAYLAAKKARKHSFEAFAFDRERESRLDGILESLRNRTYVHGPYREIVLRDSKKRYVFSPRLEDHAVHHLLHKRVYATLDSKMAGSTFACRNGYGHHKAIRHLASLVGSEAAIAAPEKLFFLKVDLSKYFFSVPHARLIAKLEKRFRDEEVLWLARKIIDGYRSPPYYDELLEYARWYVGNPDKGLPIGGILSQLFANFYLNDVDQYLKHVLKVRFVRYMDDFVILGASPRLKEIREPFFDKLREEGLVLHPKKISFHPVSEGIRFVGYRVTPDGKVWAGRKICRSYQRFMDDARKLHDRSYGFSEAQAETFRGAYASRR